MEQWAGATIGSWKPGAGAGSRGLGPQGAKAAFLAGPQKIRVFSVFRGSDGKGEAQTARRTRIETAKNLKRAISA